MPLRPSDELVTELKVLTGRHRDLSDDRTGAVNRLRGPMTGSSSVWSATPAAIRRTGVRRLAAWLRNRKVRGADQLAAPTVQAAGNQHTAVPSEKITAQVVHSLARKVMALNEKITETDKLIEGRFREHRHAEVITSMPGIGPLLGAEFLAATGGDMDAFDSADRLAGFTGVAPAARDSGKISGNLHRPKRYSRRLQRVLYTSALISIRCCDESRRFYDRKRDKGKRPSRTRARRPTGQRPVGPPA